eukprot:gene5105-224_t
MVWSLHKTFGLYICGDDQGVVKRLSVQSASCIEEMKHNSSDNDIRLAVVGSERTGKSALTVRFLTRRFIGEYDSCCDSRFQREIFLADTRIALDVKDTSKMYWMTEPKKLINWASAIIVVYSVTSRQSFLDAEKILQMIHESKPLEQGCTLLLGNKEDLGHLREVSSKEGKRLSVHYGVRFNEVSAAEGYENVYNTIMKLLVEALVVEKAKQHDASRRLSISNESLSSSGPGSPKTTIRQFMKDTISSVMMTPRLSRRTLTV